jgi:hypothetical protein
VSVANGRSPLRLALDRAITESAGEGLHRPIGAERSLPGRQAGQSPRRGVASQNRPGARVRESQNPPSRTALCDQHRGDPQA